MSRSSQYGRRGSVVNASCRVSLLASPSHLMPPNRAWDAVMERLAEGSNPRQHKDDNRETDDENGQQPKTESRRS